MTYWKVFSLANVLYIIIIYNIYIAVYLGNNLSGVTHKWNSSITINTSFKMQNCTDTEMTWKREQHYDTIHTVHRKTYRNLLLVSTFWRNKFTIRSWKQRLSPPFSDQYCANYSTMWRIMGLYNTTTKYVPYYLQI